MKNLTLLFMGLLVSTAFIGCGGDKGSSIPAAAPVSGAVNPCPLGSNLQGAVCVSPNGTLTNPNYGAGVTTAANFYSENYSTRNLNIIGETYQDFIRDTMGVCGPLTQNPDCGPWITGAIDIVLLAGNTQANQLKGIFRVAPRGANGFAPPVPIDFTLSVTNNYQGFEARAYGPRNSPAYASLIQIQVATGKLEDSFLDYRIAYRGVIIMNGRFQKCLKPSCGL